MVYVLISFLIYLNTSMADDLLIMSSLNFMTMRFSYQTNVASTRNTFLLI